MGNNLLTNLSPESWKEERECWVQADLGIPAGSHASDDRLDKWPPGGSVQEESNLAQLSMFLR